MANFIQNGGKWGPIDESGQKSYEGREIIIDFDNTATTSIMYTNPFGVAVSTETEFVWNTEAIDCANTADVQIMWQGTDDPSVANAASGSGSDVTAEDTGWTTVELLDLNGSSACDTRTVVNLSGVAGFEFGGGAHPLARFDNGLRFHPDINGSSTFTGGSFSLYGIRSF